MKIRKVDGYWNYDKSSFDAPSKLKESDEDLNKIWKNQYSLKEFTAQTNFKSYEELKTRLDAVLSGTVSVGNVTEDINDDVPFAEPKVDTKPIESKQDKDDDDTMGYFEKLANS